MPKIRANASYEERPAAPDLASATAVWRLFHKKEHPKELISVHIDWPTRWEYAGVAVTTYYNSDKWEESGKYNKYYHDHEHGRIKIWHPKGLLPWTVAKPGPGRFAYPKAVAVLGFALGVDVKRHDTEKEQRLYPEKGAYLVAAPSRKRLWIIEPTGGIVAMIAGPGLIVEARGIVG